MQNTAAGLSLLIVAAAMNASFALPMKFTRKWAWENTWLAWSIFALVLLPISVTLLTVPSLGDVYSRAGLASVLKVAAYGAGWGVSQVLFGLALQSVGIALTFSIVLGLSAAMGSLIPLFSLHQDKMFSPAGGAIFAGVVLVIAGVAVCAIAGRMRDQAQGQADSSSKPFARGLAMAIAAGICASLMNFGVAFGGSLVSAAASAGARPEWTINTIWLPLMMGGAVPNILYCLFLLRRNRTSANFNVNGTSSYWLLAMVMAIFWFGSTLMYGVASGKLGAMGAVLGWPLFMSLIVIGASVVGVLTGEWKSSGSKPLRIQMTGVAVLVIAVIVLSRASL